MCGPASVRGLMAAEPRFRHYTGLGWASIFPHLNAFPTNTLADAERWAAEIGVPAYAIDEQTAIKVVDGSVEVVSEGQWTKFGDIAAPH
jgi:hypothetical protein